MYTYATSFPKTLVDKPMEDKAYGPQPFSNELLELYEWMDILDTLDTCALSLQSQFCDENGYDIVPICTITCLREEWRGGV